jgi:diguanylate cyclase (GGDEF)-like protein/PAS domain S-box-containing protein
LKSYSVLYVSPAYEEIWGRTCASLYADARSWIDAVHPDDRDRVVQMHGIRRTTGQFDAEFRIVRPDGKLRWIHARAYPIRDALGNLYRSAGVAEDVTERKQAETRIRSLNRVHTVLSGVNALIVRATSREELYHDACRIAVEAGQFVIAWIGVADREALKVTPVASDGDVRDFFDSAPLTGSPALASGHGLAWQAIHEKKAVISNDVRNDPRTHMKKQCADRGINSMAILPLSFGGEGVGVLSLYARESGFFDEEEMKLLKELAGDISFALDHIEKSNRLDYLAYYDAATGIANRQLILERLDQRIRIAAKQESLLALAILDIERFKSINDTLGRQVGNQVLKVLADRFVKFHGEPDRVGRVLGDQFGIIIPDVRSEDDVARRIDQKMKECIGIPIRLGDGEPLRISAKVGIALYPYDGADADTLFRNAEAALKRAKATGERYLFYTQKMTERVGEKLALEGKLRQALENEEFVLHYQPKVDMATRKITGVEALIRWQSPELGLIAPMQFIPLLEQTGLILEVGAWALRRAALDYRRWTGLSLNAPRIAVNVSSIQVRRPDFAETTLASIEAEGGRSAIDLEVTESIIMEDVEVNVGKFEKLRLAGIEIAIDDFGTGYSSLGYLAKLPLQWLKIDRSFIITMLKSPAAMTLVSTIISMAHALKLKVIAEGVEAESQAKVLKRLGCDQMQGYLFSKPVDFDAITVLLRRQKSPGSMMGTAR